MIQSYRESGKVKQNQLVLWTYNWSEFAQGRISLSESEKDRMRTKFKCSDETLIKITSDIKGKIKELQNMEYIKWINTDEYKFINKWHQIINNYNRQKNLFDLIMGRGIFETVYDLHMNCHNEYVHTIYDRECNENSFNCSSVQEYSIEEKEYLRKFYKSLATKFHPDVAGDDKPMVFLNKLKEQWNV